MQHRLHHKFCGEVLPYLEIQKNDIGEKIEGYTIQMPDITGMNLEEAKKILEELELEVEVIGEGNEVIGQLPKKGIQINAGTKVTIYVE